MLKYKEYTEQVINEGWAKPNRFEDIETLIEKMKASEPSLKISIGKYWSKNFNHLKGDKDCMKVVFSAINTLGYEGKALPLNYSSGYGQPEGKSNYRFIERKDRFHTHLTKKSNMSLCWQYEKGSNNIMFDIVDHESYEEYLASNHNGSNFYLPK